MDHSRADRPRRRPAPYRGYRYGVRDCLTLLHRGAAVTSRCSFCTKTADEVETLVAGAGVFICNECVELCAVVIANKRTSGPAPRVPVWDQIDDHALLEHLPRI